MKTILKLLVIATIFMPAMFSCSGGSKVPVFGSLATTYSEYDAESEALKEEAKNIKTEEEKAKLIKKSEELNEKWGKKIESSAKSLDGKTIDFAESNFKVTEPISLQLKEFHTNGFIPEFTINGAAEAAEDITTDMNYTGSIKTVCITGYNAEGQDVYRIGVGNVDVENRDGKIFVKAGTPVKFTYMNFAKSKVDKYLEAVTVKLELLNY